MTTDVYVRYERALRGQMDKTGGMAHCDQYVLHAPKTCTYCDKYPDLQEFRIVHKMNFTDQLDTTKLPCPAIMRRSQRKIESWGGNIATIHEDV